MLQRKSHHRPKVPWLLRGKLVFASYRRRDSSDITGRICDRLVTEIGRRRLIRDIDSIPLGADFRDFIEHVIPSCRVVLALIGMDWHIEAGADGRRYFDDPKDMVGFELACALRHGVRVVPVLVGGASMPAPEALPETLRPIASLQGIAVRSDPDFHRDMDRLVAGL